MIGLAICVVLSAVICVIAYAVITGKWGKWWDRPTQYEKANKED